MNAIKPHDRGAAVDDVQRKLRDLGYLTDAQMTGAFDNDSIVAIKTFCADHGVEPVDYVDQHVWARLVDASFELGDRTLYLRVPFFHGHDVEILQSALSALGFSTGGVDGIFGAHTEEALRRFQMNMGLPDDGICGSMTFRVLNNLAHTWKEKNQHTPVLNMSFSRAAAALERNFLCLFGTTEFTRLVAARMSNLAMATNPNTRVASADSLNVDPDETTVFLQILGPEQEPAAGVPMVEYEPDKTLVLRMSQALRVAGEGCRICVRIPSESWYEAGPDRSAQHYAIVLLDAICSATLLLEEHGTR